MNICFFSNTTLKQLNSEQYSVQDIEILRTIDETLVVANTWRKIPWTADLYFSWWVTGSVLPLLKAKISGKPIIVVAGGNEALFYSDSVSGKPHGYLNSSVLKKFVVRLVLRYSNLVLVVSKYMLSDVEMLGASKVRVVYNSVNTDLFKPRGIRRKYLTSIFSLTEAVRDVKRIDIFISAMQRVLEYRPDLTIVVIGAKGDYYNHIRLKLESLGLFGNFHFTGLIDNSRVAEYMALSVGYVQISDTETFGVAVAEAMSSGTPVVVSKVGGLPEVVGDCGIYVDQNNALSVFSGIKELLDMSEKSFEELSNKCRERIVKNFSFTKRKEKISLEIKKIIDFE